MNVHVGGVFACRPMLLCRTCSVTKVSRCPSVESSKDNCCGCASTTSCIIAV